MFFPNDQCMIDNFIMQAGDLLDKVITNNEIDIYEMPAVQILALLLDHDKIFEQLRNN